MSTIEFNSAILKLKDALRFFALKLTENEDDAMDLFQDTYLKAVTYREKFTDSSNLKAWMYTIMKNTFINNYRRSLKTNTIIDGTKDLYYINTSRISENMVAEASVSYKEILGKVNGLEIEYREPFQMHYTGYKYKEIADKLHLPIGTVKSRIFIARQKLMEQLKDLVN